VSRLRRLAQKAGLSELVAMGSNVRIVGADLPDSRQVRLTRMYPGAKHFAQTHSVSVPMPTVRGERMADQLLIEWVGDLLRAIFLTEEAAKQTA
jgi:transcription-repair coupling factor (superfamily II helicase)